jgi:hypothetical protein
MRCGGEIEVVVVAAGGVEGGVTVGADGIAGEVVGDGEDGAARAAEDGGFVEFGGGPGSERMIGEGVVAILAGVEEAAAFHFDGDDVERGVVMEAAGLRIEIEAADFDGRGRHGLSRGKIIREMDESKNAARCIVPVCAGRARNEERQEKDAGLKPGATQLAGDVL